jgi:O-antigen ligase
LPAITTDENTGETNLVSTSPQGTLKNDMGTFNNRTHMWLAAFAAIRENPFILIWGVPKPGRYITEFCSYRVSHLHNSWMECLIGLGLVGFLIAVLITVVTGWNCLIILLKHHQDIWKRNTAILTLCILASAFLEPYLFYTWVDYHLVELLLFLCAGYVALWQEADNRHILNAVRGKLLQKK